MSQARDGAVKEVLTDLEAAQPGSVAGLVLRSGAFFAGRAPAAVNREVYAAMVAAMLGASESATSDLAADVQVVQARTKSAVLCTAPVGRKLVLVLYAVGNVDPSAHVTAAAQRLAPLF